jgi:hypothetical protein
MALLHRAIYPPAINIGEPPVCTHKNYALGSNWGCIDRATFALDSPIWEAIFVRSLGDVVRPANHNELKIGKRLALHYCFHLRFESRE